MMVGSSLLHLVETILAGENNLAGIDEPITWSRPAAEVEFHLHQSVRVFGHLCRLHWAKYLAEVMEHLYTTPVSVLVLAIMVAKKLWKTSWQSGSA